MSAVSKTSTGTQQARLGRQIRQLRQEQGLTLVALAGLTRLSHPFLSQLERGLARPSMGSLERIATALHSSQSELMARAVDDGAPAAGPPFTVVRADGGTELPAPGGSGSRIVTRWPSAAKASAQADPTRPAPITAIRCAAGEGFVMGAVSGAGSCPGSPACGHGRGR